MGHMLAVQLLPCMQRGAEASAGCIIHKILSIHPLPCWVMAQQPQGLGTPLSQQVRPIQSPHDAPENLPAADLETNCRGVAARELDSPKNS